MTGSCPRCGSDDCKCAISPANLYKNNGTVMVLAIVAGLLGFAGVGHIYLGKVRRGVGFLVCTLACMFVGIMVLVEGIAYWLPFYDEVGTDYGLFYGGAGIIIVGVGLFVWSVYDAKVLCNIYNHCLVTDGTPPW